MSTDRRSFLKLAGLAGLPLLGGAPALQAMASGFSPANLPPNNNRRLLTIYLRGGNDALNTVIPYRDVGYARQRWNTFFTKGANPFDPNRSGIAIPGYDDLALHPSLGGVANLIPSGGGGPVAFLHRVGNFNAQRSHFTEQHLTETGRQIFSANDEGWIPQLMPGLFPGGNPLAPLTTISASNRLMRMYLGTEATKATTHLQGAYGPPDSFGMRKIKLPFGAAGASARVANFVKAVNTDDQSALSYTLAGEGEYLRSSLESAIEARQDLANAPDINHADAKYPMVSAANEVAPNTLNKFAGFFGRLEETVEFLVRKDATAAGIELGGWDFHENLVSRQAVLLAVLDRAITSAYADLSAANGGNEEFLIMVVTEFGRTNKDNGPAYNPATPGAFSTGAGTDHGVGGVYMAIGSSVNGGVYNASHPTWSQNANLPTGNADWRPLLLPATQPEFENALEPVTDFRVPMVEVAKKFFGFLDPEINNLSGVGSEWGDILANQGVTENTLLDFLS